MGNYKILIEYINNVSLLSHKWWLPSINQPNTKQIMIELIKFDML